MNRSQIKRAVTQEALAATDKSGNIAVLGMHVEEFTNPATADVNGIKESIASAASEQTYTGSDLDGAVGEGTMSPPRNITITTSSHTDIDAVGVVVTGTDVNGDTISETITLTNNGNTTDVGAKAFATVTSIVVPAQTGTGGALEFGFGDLIGLGKKAKDMAGEPVVLCEVEAGSIVATGTFATASVGAPNGTYSANNAPNASRDYALVYLVDEY